MPRYIDVEKISDLFDVEYKSTKKLIEQGETHLNNLAEGFFEAYLVTQKIPTADVKEVKHGKWEECGKLEGKTVLKCSQCSQGITERFSPKYFYCPNCGAKMDGKD